MTTVPPPELKNSVTAGDANPEANSLGFFQFFPYYLRAFSNSKLLPELPAYGSLDRDYVLSTTLDYPGFWQSAVFVASSLFVSKSFDLRGNAPTLIKRSWDLLENCNGGEGLETLMLQVAADYFTTNNGGHIEIVRASDSPLAKITGLYHLDSLRCRRTGNPETPIMYFNTYDSSWHYLKWYEVFSMSDMPTGRNNYYSTGHCAAERSYDRVRRLQAIERYVYEKITGGGPQKLIGLTGMSQQNLENILTMDEAQRTAKGLAVYGGAAMFAFIARDAIGKVEIDLASLPESFDSKEEINQALLLYADSLGIDMQDLQPLTGSALGTSAQSQVLDDKAKGKGLSLLTKRWTKFMNRWVLPEQVTMVYVERDLRDRQQEAQIFSSYATSVTAMVEKGLISADQGKQLMVDKDLLPREFIPVDTTPEISVSFDQEKLDVSTPDSPTNKLEALIARLGQKEVRAVDELENARKIYQELIAA